MKIERFPDGTIRISEVADNRLIQKSNSPDGPWATIPYQDGGSWMDDWPFWIKKSANWDVDNQAWNYDSADFTEAPHWTDVSNFRFELASTRTVLIITNMMKWVVPPGQDHSDGYWNPGGIASVTLNGTAIPAYMIQPAGIDDANTSNPPETNGDAHWTLPCWGTNFGQNQSAAISVNCGSGYSDTDNTSPDTSIEYRTFFAEVGSSIYYKYGNEISTAIPLLINRQAVITPQLRANSSALVAAGRFLSTYPHDDLNAVAASGWLDPNSVHKQAADTLYTYMATSWDAQNGPLATQPLSSPEHAIWAGTAGLWYGLGVGTFYGLFLAFEKPALLAGQITRSQCKWLIQLMKCVDWYFWNWNRLATVSTDKAILVSGQPSSQAVTFTNYPTDNAFSNATTGGTSPMGSYGPNQAFLFMGAIAQCIMEPVVGQMTSSDVTPYLDLTNNSAHTPHLYSSAFLTDPGYLYNRKDDATLHGGITLVHDLKQMLDGNLFLVSDNGYLSIPGK